MSRDSPILTKARHTLGQVWALGFSTRDGLGSNIRTCSIFRQLGLSDRKPDARPNLNKIGPKLSVLGFSEAWLGPT